MTVFFGVRAERVVLSLADQKPSVKVSGTLDRLLCADLVIGADGENGSLVRAMIQEPEEEFPPGATDPFVVAS